MKAVLFDLDGTLVESLQGISDALNAVLEKNDFPTYEKKEVRKMVGDGSWVLLRRALPKDIKDEQVDSFEKQFQKEYERFWEEGTHPFDGITELLSRCKSHGLRCCVLSNKKHSFSVEISERVFGKDAFELVFGQRAGVEKKPSPEGALAIAEELKLNPEECYFVGDSVVDIETACNAEMKPIAVSWGYHDRSRLEAFSCPVIDTVSQLQEHLLAHL